MIYLLSRKSKYDYDEYDAKVIRAKNPKEAREIANKYTGDEGKIWTDTELVSCEKINLVGTSREILGSFNAG